MKAVAILLCMYMVSMVSTLPIISKPLENNPDHLVWEALLSIDTHRSDDKTRKIPKSIFITPNLNESKGNCPPEHKLGPDGRCYKTLKIDPLVILKTQIESLLNKNRTATTEYDEDYDYSEYGESTESMNSNGQYTVPLSFGFGSDNRIPQQHLQQTTFPNLNRVVKDSHITPGLSISSEKQNQPFLVSTTGLDLGAEDDSVESKSETSSSAATASNIVPSTTKTTIADATTSVSPVSSTTAASSTPNTDTTTNSQEVQPQSTDSSTPSDETLIDNDESTSVSSATNGLDLSSTTLTTGASSTEAQSTTMVSSSVKSLEEEVTTSTDQIVSVTTASSDKASSTSTSESVSTSTEVSEEIMPSSTENVKPIPDTQTEIEERPYEAEIVAVTIQPEIVTVKSSTQMPIESVETHNESSKELPALSHIAIEEPTEKPSTTTPANNDALSTEKKESNTDNIRVMSAKLVADPVTEQNESSEEKVIIVQAQNNSELVTGAEDSRSDSYEVVDAIFIPSQSELLEELDPAVGKSLNNTVGEPKYRLENASAILDDELSEAEIAPVINTGKDARANIELVNESDESPQHQQEDEQKNLSDRLAEELLFQGATLEVPKSEEASINDTIEVSDNPEKNGSASIVNENMDAEDILSDAPLGIETNVGSEVTTVESIDYDSKEIKFPTESTNLAETSEITKIDEYEGELPVKEAVPFDIPVSRQEIFQRPRAPAPPSPSIYSQFLERLKFAPPVVDLQRLQTVQYSHNPFDLRTAIRNLDRRPTQPVTSHPFRFPDDGDRSFESTGIVDESPVRGKSLQIGINCYLRSLVNKQQFIICDNA